MRALLTIYAIIYSLGAAFMLRRGDRHAGFQQLAFALVTIAVLIFCN
jgi:hypothetical protein